MEDLLQGKHNLCMLNFWETIHLYSVSVLPFLIIRVEASPYQFKERKHKIKQMILNNFSRRGFLCISSLSQINKTICILAD